MKEKSLLLVYIGCITLRCILLYTASYCLAPPGLRGISTTENDPFRNGTGESETELDPRVVLYKFVQVLKKFEHEQIGLNQDIFNATDVELVDDVAAFEKELNKVAYIGMLINHLKKTLESMQFEQDLQGRNRTPEGKKLYYKALFEAFDEMAVIDSRFDQRTPQEQAKYLRSKIKAALDIDSDSVEQRTVENTTRICEQLSVDFINVFLTYVLECTLDKRTYRIVPDLEVRDFNEVIIPVEILIAAIAHPEPDLLTVDYYELLKNLILEEGTLPFWSRSFFFHEKTLSKDYGTYRFHYLKLSVIADFLSLSPSQRTENVRRVIQWLGIIPRDDDLVREIRTRYRFFTELFEKHLILVLPASPAGLNVDRAVRKQCEQSY